MAAGCAQRLDGRVLGKELYDGKLDRPSLFRRGLGAEELDQLRQGASPLEIGRQDLVAAWDFSKERHTSRIRDLGPNKLHATAVNLPARAVTGHNWSGRESDFRRSPGEYGAIHFHSDDLEDAAWRTDFTLTVPQNLRSGIYAARLRGADREDHIPFFVRPREGARRAPAALLVPTLTYLAYANERMDYSRSLAALRPARGHSIGIPETCTWWTTRSYRPPSTTITETAAASSMPPDCDPSPTCAPSTASGGREAPATLASDLYLVDWLETKGFACDIITDEDLHARGLELLSHYRVLLTSTHPEYTTGDMLSALEQYLGRGGRLMYLGGNGFYWVTSVSAENPMSWRSGGDMPGRGPGNRLPERSTTALPGRWEGCGDTGARPPTSWWGGAFPAWAGARSRRATLVLLPAAIRERLSSSRVSATARPSGTLAWPWAGAAGDELDVSISSWGPRPRPSCWPPPPATTTTTNRSSRISPSSRANGSTAAAPIPGTGRHGLLRDRRRGGGILGGVHVLVRQSVPQRL